MNTENLRRFRQCLESIPVCVLCAYIANYLGIETWKEARDLKVVISYSFYALLWFSLLIILMPLALAWWKGRHASQLLSFVLCSAYICVFAQPRFAESYSLSGPHYTADSVMQKAQGVLLILAILISCVVLEWWTMKDKK